MKRHLLFASSVFLLMIAAAGCMSYEKPPIAISSGTFSSLPSSERNTLSPDLRTLSLEQAQEIALKNNFDFRRIQFSIDLAKARYYQTFSGYAPKINAGMTVSQSFAKMYSTENNPTTQNDTYRPSLSGQLLIFDCLTREMNILSAKYTYKQSKSQVDDARRLLLRGVAYAYNDILLTMAQKSIVEAEIMYNERMLSVAEKKCENGMVLLSDVLTFRVNLRNAQLNLVKAQYNIDSAVYVLSAYLGIIDGTMPSYLEYTKVPLEDAFAEIPSLSICLDEALANRPDLRAYREQLKSSRYAYWGLLGVFGPQVTASFQLDYNRGRTVTNSTGTSLSDSSKQGGLSYGIAAEWNLFNGFYDYYNLKAAKASVAANDFALAQSWVDVITDVRTAHANFLSSVKEAVMSREICDLALQTRDLIDNEYQAGTALITRVTEAERDYVKAQNNLVTAIVNTNNAKAQLEAAVYSNMDINKKAKTL